MATGINIKFDGVLLPAPDTFQWGLQDISASDAGRTDDSVMHKNRVAQKRTIKLGWSYPTWAEACKIIQAANPEYISVTYPDLLSGSKNETRTFYVGDRTAPLKMWTVGDQVFDAISFDLIEQ